MPESYDSRRTWAEQLGWPDIEQLLPLDFTRKEMACEFVITAIAFLVSHEYAHIEDGHIDYRYSPFGKGELKTPEGSSRYISVSGFSAGRTKDTHWKATRICRWRQGLTW